jgi:hypothetical protein
MAVDIYYRAETGVQCCGVAAPGEIFSVPLFAVYTQSGEFYFQPVDGRMG